jgi:hypothetical protein
MFDGQTGSHRNVMCRWQQKRRKTVAWPDWQPEE